ncbi:bacillithiol system redox-active protein YtxJ [Pedobacter sp. SD-b]|uniref:Bacillithiol system redox-active protein YtxJ n=1 Tax=Pedobacter segetis TaxID=2793069 RepID=A0ABS1BGP7_9SPHI|nr:bacillithiol system redox-active protein YtxJ [Pedobacter segetis]MBK0382035.1 bacillithiol system redox-active protein YtxJ [Pedobacter segetis]
MSWIKLEDSKQLQEIKLAAGYSLIFKHSTRCSISMMAKKRVDMDLDDLPENVTPYFLDLIAHREISGQIAELFQVHHESPQLLLIKDGDCVLDQSHGDISIEETLGLIN